MPIKVNGKPFREYIRNLLGSIYALGHKKMCVLFRKKFYGRL